MNLYFIPVIFEINPGETTDVMETTLFTNLSERGLNLGIKTMSAFLDCISLQNKLDLTVLDYGVVGSAEDLVKASDILKNSVISN